MDWSLMADHYIQLLGDTTYWVIMALWLAIPYAGVGVLLYAAYKGGQSMTPKARKDARMEKELQQMLKETHNGR